MLKKMWEQLKDDVWASPQTRTLDEHSIAYLDRRFKNVVDWYPTVNGLVIVVENDTLDKVMAKNCISRIVFDEEFQKCDVYGFVEENNQDVESIKKWMLRHKIWTVEKYKNQKAQFQKLYEVAA